jgi:hypothetical protein
MSTVVDWVLKPFLYPTAQLAVTGNGSTVTATLPNAAQLTLGLAEMQWKPSTAHPHVEPPHLRDRG